jgi:protein ImuB
MLSADRWLREHAAPRARTRSPTPLPPPMAFVEKQGGAMRIMAVNDAALALDLAPGMALADARARVPDLAVEPFDAAANLALLEALADACDRYTPMVALDPPDGLILDITGCTHLFEDEDGLLSDLAARLAEAGMTVLIARAETPDRARALARHGGESVAIRRDARGHRPSGNSVHEERSAYQPALPVSALDLDEASTTALRRAGLYTIDDLARRPRGPLAARFGMTAVTRLARVLGEEDVRITPRRAPPAFFFIHRFAEPAARTAYVLGVLGELAREAETALRERHQGGRHFIASLYRSDGDTRRLSVETGSPTRDPALLMRLMHERIEALSDPLDPGFGYDAVRLDVIRTEPLAAVQGVISGESSEAGAALAGLADRLAVRLGQARIRRFAPGNSHIPECAGFTLPAHAPPLPFPWESAVPGDPPFRPLHLFDPPQRIDVIAEVPDGPPRQFRWRRATHDVVAHEGPERIAAEWWRRKRGHEPGQAGLTRDYFRVEDREGRRYWLFRHGLYGAEKPNPDWYVHGLFA